MRYNPPPNWPPPPPGWQPSPSWAPDPAWPPAPPGWQLFVDDDDAPADAPADDPADAPADAPAEERPNAAVPDSLEEISADRLSVDHVGGRAMVIWDEDGRYEIGTIAGVSAEPATITVRLSGSAAIEFARDGAGGGPRLYVSK